MADKEAAAAVADDAWATGETELNDLYDAGDDDDDEEKDANDDDATSSSFAEFAGPESVGANSPAALLQQANAAALAQYAFGPIVFVGLDPGITNFGFVIALVVKHGGAAAAAAAAASASVECPMDAYVLGSGTLAFARPQMGISSLATMASAAGMLVRQMLRCSRLSQTFLENAIAVCEMPYMDPSGRRAAWTGHQLTLVAQAVGSYLAYVCEARISYPSSIATKTFMRKELNWRTLAAKGAQGAIGFSPPDTAPRPHASAAAATAAKGKEKAKGYSHAQNKQDVLAWANITQFADAVKANSAICDNHVADAALQIAYYAASISPAALGLPVGTVERLTLRWHPRAAVPADLAAKFSIF